MDSHAALKWSALTISLVLDMIIDAVESKHKNRVLVVADHQPLMVSIRSRFLDSGWLIDAVSTQAWLSQQSQRACDYDDIVLLIDKDFRRRFGNIIHEMVAMIRNCSAHAPVYLLCEGGYEPCFSPWLDHIKQVFEFEADQKSLCYSIDYIIKQKSFSTGGLYSLSNSVYQQKSANL